MFGTNLYLFFLIIVLHFSSCSPGQPTASRDSVPENNSTAVLTRSPTPENSTRVFQSEYFEKEWKGKYEKTLAELNKNRLLWQENKIGNYDFVCEQFRGGMYGYPRVVVKVRDGKPFSLEGTENLDLTMNRIDDYDKMGSFENMFDFLLAELEKGRILTVIFNKLGYPQVVDILYFYGTHGSKRIRISKFEIIK